MTDDFEKSVGCTCHCLLSGLYFGNFLRASVELCYIAFDLQDEEAHKPTSIGLANFRFLRRI